MATNIAKRKEISQITQEQSRVMVDCIILVVLILMALTRWIPGGDPLQPETGIRAYLEVALLGIGLVYSLLRWGFYPFIKSFHSPTFLVLAIFCLWAGITSFWAPSFLIAVGKAGSLFAICLISGVVAQQIKHNSLSVAKILSSSLLFLILLLIIVNWISKGNPFPLIFQGGRTRLTLGFIHPNETSEIFSVFILSLFIFFRETRTEREKKLLVGVFLLSMIGLYFTKSRTSAGALLIAFSIFILITIKNPNSKVIIFAAVCLLGLGMAIFLLSGSIEGNVFYLNSFDFELITLEGRWEVWQKLLQTMNGANILGSGYYSPRFILLPYFDWASTAHNGFLEIFVGTGFVGIFLLVLFYLANIQVILKPKKYAFQFLMLVFISTSSLLESNLFVPCVPMAATILVLLSTEYGPKKEVKNDIASD